MWSKMAKYVVFRKLQKLPNSYHSLELGYFSNQRQKNTNFSFSIGKLVNQMRILPLLNLPRYQTFASAKICEKYFSHTYSHKNTGSIDDHAVRAIGPQHDSGFTARRLRCL